jgi:hypothetical protein
MSEAGRTDNPDEMLLTIGVRRTAADGWRVVAWTDGVEQEMTNSPTFSDRQTAELYVKELVDGLNRRALHELGRPLEIDVVNGDGSPPV